MLSMIVLLLLSIIFTYTNDMYLKKFIFIVTIIKIFISIILFQHYNYNIFSIFSDQYEYMERATTIYNSDNPFDTYGNISHYLYIFMITVLLNIYNNISFAILDLTIAQCLASILTHIYIYKLIKLFIINNKKVFYISMISLVFLTLYSYNIFIIRDSWYFLFFIMSIFYILKFKITNNYKYLFITGISLIMLLQMRFFSAMFFIVAYNIAFSKSKSKTLILFIITFLLFIVTFSLFYNMSIIEGYLSRLLDIETLKEFLLYNIEGFFNLSFMRFGDYNIVFKMIRFLIPETLFVVIATYYYFKLKSNRLDILDTALKFIIILTFFHISTYFFYSAAEWKIRQAGILSLAYVIFVAIKFVSLKETRKGIVI